MCFDDEAVSCVTRDWEASGEHKETNRKGSDKNVIRPCQFRQIYDQYMIDIPEKYLKRFCFLNGHQ